MWRVVAFLLFASLAVPTSSSKPSCESLPALIVNDYIIEGIASQEGQPPPVAFVLLYSRGKLIRHVLADAQGQFTLYNLSPGHYRLSIDGVGSFDVEVRPKAGIQRRYYGFSVYHGCLSWGFTTN